MLKILKIPSQDAKLQELSRNIVTYNNSQNAINQKVFTANTEAFLRVQTEFEKKGWLLCIKQSDKNKFSKQYKTVTKLQTLNNELVAKFGLEKVSKTRDYEIDLEKLLQVILAFAKSGHEAITKSLIY